MTDFIVERGYTLAYPRVDDVGLSLYVVYFFVYMTLVEIGVYWMHRLLHDIKPLYQALHVYHHIYNKQHTLSPFAGMRRQPSALLVSCACVFGWVGLAFHPVDGMLQAMPYVIALFIVPMHYFTHVLLLFMTGVLKTEMNEADSKWSVRVFSGVDDEYS